MDKKATKAEAKYTLQSTEAKHCGVCTMFRPPHSCTAVAGRISSEAVCKFFEKRKTPRAIRS